MPAMGLLLVLRNVYILFWVSNLTSASELFSTLTTTDVLLVEPSDSANDIELKESLELVGDGEQKKWHDLIRKIKEFLPVTKETKTDSN